MWCVRSRDGQNATKPGTHEGAVDAPSAPLGAARLVPIDRSEAARCGSAPPQRRCGRSARARCGHQHAHQRHPMDTGFGGAPARATFSTSLVLQSEVAAASQETSIVSGGPPDVKRDLLKAATLLSEAKQLLADLQESPSQLAALALPDSDVDWHLENALGTVRYHLRLLRQREYRRLCRAAKRTIP